MRAIKIVCAENKAVRNGEKLKKKIVTQSIVIFTLLLVPALYALIFLGAYWNPISHTSDIPIAVVNSDEGVVVNGGAKNIGNELVESLKSNDQVNWIFTNQEDADAGVASQDYYAELVIPSDFTKNIASAGSETKIQGTIYFKSTDKKGMMASSILDNLSGNLEATINKTISKSIVDTLSISLKSLPAGLQQLSNGLGQYISQPVVMEHSKIAEAENTGTALAPFMISLCLYIGAFMIMITIFGMDNVKFDELKISRKIGFDLGLFRYQIIGIVQAVMIGFTVHILLGLHMDSAIGFYGVCILGSLAFTTLIQVIVMLFKGFGKILCLLFMVCQLTAGGGVLPTEILPDFYKAMHPFMPMTYTINALRNTILGMESDNFQYNCGILIVITVISALIVMLLSFLEYRKNQEA